MTKKTKDTKKVQEQKVEDKKGKDINTGDYKDLIEQTKSEYRVAWDFMKPKFDERALRLKLYNNQKKDKLAIGDPLMFTIHQTVLASLYNDKLNVDFIGREEGDQEKAENISSLASFDFDEMDMDLINYEFDWDTTFFGRGLLLLMEFDRKLKCPIPEVIDIMTWLRDPRATSVNGDKKGRGAMRFGGRPIRLSMNEMDKAGVYFNYKDLKPEKSSDNTTSLLDQASRSRSEAQGYSVTPNIDNVKGDNSQYKLLEWFTHYNGKKVLVTLADNNNRVVRIKEIETDNWPIVDRSLYPIAHDWDNVSIPDLTEDKQRARAKLQNLGLAGIEIGLHPTYLYDTNKIKNRGNLQVDFNKNIPVDGNPSGAIQPVERQTVKSEVGWILDILDVAAQKSTATPDVQQGMQSEKDRPLGETQLIASRVDTRYSLSAKIFGWSEKRFWKQWYSLYKNNFKEGIDEKIIRINGAMGPKWKGLTREDIIAKSDPDISIESRIIANNNKINDLQKYRLFFKDILATDPQNMNLSFALRKIGKLSGFKKDEIEQILPPTIDEIVAEDENLKLNDNNLTKVNVYDDDFVHIAIHNNSADTKAKYAHINAHKKAMMLKRVNNKLDIDGNRPEQPQQPQEMDKINFQNPKQEQINNPNG